MENAEIKRATNLSKVSTHQALISYLSSNDRLDSSKQVYHYTRLSSILSIIKSGYWVIRSPKDMNDNFEYQNWNENDWTNIFFISFMSEQKENIGMWSLYAQPWHEGVKVAIEARAFKNWIKNTKSVYKANPNTFEVDEHSSFTIGEAAKIKFTSVAYSDFELPSKPEHIHVGAAQNDILKTVTGVPSLAGYIKNDAWDYEKEIRLRVDLARNIDCEAVAIKLTSELIDAMTITKGPRFKGNLQEVIENELQKNISHGTSLFFNRITTIPCDRCIKRKEEKNETN